MNTQQITTERAHQLFSYNPDTGEIIRKISTCSSVKAGQLAGCIMGKGYIVIGVDGRKYLAHRLAWLMFTGNHPDGQIDHINGIKTDNRIANLRCVDGSTNMENQRTARPGNSSGLLGVSWMSRAGKWRAQIQINGAIRYLGLFACKLKAHEVYLEAKRQNHLGCSL